SVCFDTGLVRMAAGWTGEFLDLSRAHLATMKGDSAARPKGTLQFATRVGPGWACDGKFDDPGADGQAPLPPTWAHYRGLYRHGERVVLSCSVGATDVLELPGGFTAGGRVAFTRTLHIGRCDRPMSVTVCDADDAAAIIDSG